MLSIFLYSLLAFILCTLVHGLGHYSELKCYHIPLELKFKPFPRFIWNTNTITRTNKKAIAINIAKQGFTSQLWFGIALLPFELFSICYYTISLLQLYSYNYRHVANGDFYTITKYGRDGQKERKKFILGFLLLFLIRTLISAFL